MKTLLLDTSRLAAVAALAIVKFHKPMLDLQKVMVDADLAELVDSEDDGTAAEEIIKKVDL
jgi:hypothetical protein